MKKFLKTFAVVAAGFAAQSASAAIAPVTTDTFDAHEAMATDSLKQPETIAVRTDSGDAFNFVLKRVTETGLMMAYHTSHASHASHSSHYSGR
jgi:nicotinic acid phosphoribosyltransferase